MIIPLTLSSPKWHFQQIRIMLFIKVKPFSSALTDHRCFSLASLLLIHFQGTAKNSRSTKNERRTS
jgi:hypothetical protein